MFSSFTTQCSKRTKKYLILHHFWREKFKWDIFWWFSNNVKCIMHDLTLIDNLMHARVRESARMADWNNFLYQTLEFGFPLLLSKNQENRVRYQKLRNNRWSAVVVSNKHVIKSNKKSCQILYWWCWLEFPWISKKLQ